MTINSQYYNFYRPEMDAICQNINKGHVSLVVGINSIGKTLLVNQLQTERFKFEFLKESNVKLVFLEFKDKNPPNPTQLYKYWLEKTAAAVGFALPKAEKFNDFSFHFFLSEMVRHLKPKEKLIFIVLDAQNILNQGEAFYRSLIYLHRFTYGQVSYVFLSEPQILDHKNLWVQRFVQDLTNRKYIFLKMLDKDTTLADIKREAGLQQTSLKEKQVALILKYSGGLHGVIGALVYFLKNNPQLDQIQQLKQVVFNDLMFKYWIEDILASLPIQSVRILKDVLNDSDKFNTHQDKIYGKWLVDLGFLKNNGQLRHPLMQPYIESFSMSKAEGKNQLHLTNDQFFIGREKISLTKKERAVLGLLYKAKGKLVTYDKIGEMLWKGDPDNYSLWAIAQIIYRLKKKLRFYSLNSDTINTRRGEGYSLI